jgi:hypothetical protein
MVLVTIFFTAGSFLLFPEDHLIPKQYNFIPSSLFMKPASELLQILEESQAAFQRIPQEEWRAKPHAHKWSKKEVLGHLVDSALTNLRRFIMTQYQPGEKIVYHQDEWVALQHYQEADLDDLIQLWAGLNRQIARVVERIPPERMHLSCDTGKAGQELHTLDYLIEDYLAHLKHHLAQIGGRTPQPQPL